MSPKAGQKATALISIFKINSNSHILNVQSFCRLALFYIYGVVEFRKITVPSAQCGDSEEEIRCVFDDN